MPRSCSTERRCGGSSPKRRGVHFAHDLEAQFIIQGQFGLVEQAIGTRAAGLARRVEAHAGLADPDQQGADPGGQGTGGMGDTGARFEHETGDAAHGDVGTHAVLVHHDEGAVEHVEFAALDVEDGEALLDGDGARGREDIGQGPRHSLNKVTPPRATALPW